MQSRPLTALVLSAAALGVLSLQANAGNGQTNPISVDYNQIVQTVTDAGYTFGTLEIEDGEIEVEATKDGKEWELTLSPKTGEIIDVEQED